MNTLSKVLWNKRNGKREELKYYFPQNIHVIHFNNFSQKFTLSMLSRNHVNLTIFDSYPFNLQ